MNNNETKALQKAIEVWIGKNIDSVVKAQELSKLILDCGFLEPSKTLPFQIVPTTLSDSDGGIICKLYVNLENPIYGFFVIEITDNDCGITCPNTYHIPYFVCNLEDCKSWINTLDDEMNIFYQLSSAAEEKQTIFCQNTLNELLQNYKNLIHPEIEKIKEKIYSDEKIAIYSNNFFALAKDAQKDFSKALLIPPAWVVFKDLNDLPDPDEQIDDYIDEDLTNSLFEELSSFSKQENYYAAPVYLAQRILLQTGYDVRAFSQSEDSWVVAAITEELGEFVLPPIDINQFEVV